MKKIGAIEVETVLLPWVIAGQVAREVAVYFQREMPESLEQYLADRAQRCYEKHDQFRRLTRRISGREHLYMFMRHWAADWMWRTYGVRMPDRFGIGEQLTPTERYTGAWPKRNAAPVLPASNE